MFLCPKCKKDMILPKCSCGYFVDIKNGICQLLNMPDMITDGCGDKYIGYESIGKNYSGNRKYVIEKKDIILASEISVFTGDGIFLDLACGDGCFTVPCAANKIKVISGDISNQMLSILQKKAEYNNISLNTVTLCRMNALEIPISTECVDVVVANSVLHLISNPEKVINEIYRVLKPGGVFLCFDDVPGKSEEAIYDNALYHEIVNSIYGEYWNCLVAYGIKPLKYQWNFDREYLCKKIFSKVKEKSVPLSGDYKVLLSDGFYHVLSGEGFLIKQMSRR